MNILKFVLLYWDSILVVIAFLVGIIALYKKGETKILSSILFRLVTRAEKEYGGGTGELKKAAVIEWVYEKIPVILKLIITQRELEKMIDDVLAYAKAKWVANPHLQSYIADGPTEIE